MKIFSELKKQILKRTVMILQKSTYFSALACRLTQLTGKHPDPIHPKHLIEIRPSWFLPYIKKHHQVLDIGCHNGQRTLKAAKKCKYIVGIDYDRWLLKMAEKEAARQQLSNVMFTHADVEQKLPFNSNKFDAILFLDVLEHLNQRSFVLTEVHRVLKTGGYLFISVPNSHTTWKKLQRSIGLSYFSDPDHKVEFSKIEIQKLLESTGFKINNISPVVYDTPFIGFIDLVGGLSLTLYSYLIQWRRKTVLKKPAESIGWEILCQKK